VVSRCYQLLSHWTITTCIVACYIGIQDVDSVVYNGEIYDQEARVADIFNAEVIAVYTHSSLNYILYRQDLCLQ